jgi:hypothetical protein
MDQNDHDLLIEIRGGVADLVALVKGVPGNPGLVQRTGSLENWRSYVNGALAILAGLWAASVLIGGVLLAAALKR